MHTIAGGLRYIDLDFLGRPRVIRRRVQSAAAWRWRPGPVDLSGDLRASSAAGIEREDIRALLLTTFTSTTRGRPGRWYRSHAAGVHVHERGAPHLGRPVRLLATRADSTARHDRLWGEFLPVPAANIRELRGGEQLDVAGRRFEVAYLPGHASHHVGYLDRSSGVALVGDTAGVRTGRALFVMPPTPPPDIDIEAWLKSVELIRAWRPSTLFVTHFGPHEDVTGHLDAFAEHLDALSRIARRVLDGEESGEGSEDELLQAFTAEARLYLQRHLPPEEVDLYDFASPLALGWLGLARYWRKRRAARA